MKCPDCNGKGGLTGYNHFAQCEQDADCGTCDGSGCVLMPPIEIPYSPRRAANEKRYGMARTDVQQCLLCLKPVNPDTCRYVVLTSDLGMIADPDIESTNEPNGGGFYIGSECWRKNPQLWDYRVRI